MNNNREQDMSKATVWSEEIPTEPGWYWFWGTTTDDRDDGEVAVVRMIQVWPGPIYAEGECEVRPFDVDAYGDPDCQGHWTPAIVPELPEVK